MDIHALLRGLGIEAATIERVPVVVHHLRRISLTHGIADSSLTRLVVLNFLLSCRCS